ncbi:hypothetical protein LSH36_54g07006 [Paralvinella palmiformis]|uniref:RRM domain-containing protein n=1 Tax=Paralvinella palmiformis TaxID=53620 RepID=A0AAD9K5B0_9ANNE|nr:hypothetical protein LSH36_54g07006 [Paralvinella palmiformis]
MNIDIIEFVRPDDNKNSLYITGVSETIEQNELYDILYEKFSPFGLLYEVFIMDSRLSTTVDPNQLDSVTKKSHSCPGSLYAFVKFYSQRAAARAKRELTGQLCIAGNCIKIQYSTRQPPAEAVSLYHNKCYELANYYLGFNGWSISIIMCKENKEHSVIKPDQVQYICGVKLHIPCHGLTTEGYGVATTSYDNKDPPTKGVAVCRAKKQAHQQAVQNGFCHLIIIVLDNSKVYVDINSTVEDRIYCDEQLEFDNLLKVTELDYNPRDEDDTEFNDSDDIDLINLQFLEELETSCT